MSRVLDDGIGGGPTGIRGMQDKFLSKAGYNPLADQGCNTFFGLEP
jgi:hypothetical protein